MQAYGSYKAYEAYGSAYAGEEQRRYARYSLGVNAEYQYKAYAYDQYKVSSQYQGKEQAYYKDAEKAYYSGKGPEASYKGKCLDISKGGVRLRTNEKLGQGDRVYMKFALPGYKTPIQARGYVRWAASATSKEYGISFYRIEDGKRKQLETYLRSRTQEGKAATGRSQAKRS